MLPGDSARHRAFSFSAATLVLCGSSQRLEGRRLRGPATPARNLLASSVPVGKVRDKADLAAIGYANVGSVGSDVADCPV